jgi:hypothetical protein
MSEVSKFKIWSDFSIEISKQKKILKDLETKQKLVFEEILKSGIIEDRYYQLKKEIIPGNREVSIVLLVNKYPELYSKYKIESIRIEDLKKDLSDDEISAVSDRKKPFIKYSIVKKSSAEVISA